MDILIITYDEWQQMWVNGELKKENHSISLKEGLELLGIDFTSRPATQEEERALCDYA